MPDNSLSLFRSLRHRNYRLFFVGQIISLTGTWMQSVAQSWLVYRMTGSAVLLGWTGFAGQVPVLLLSPLAGAVADRYDRRRLVIATQAASMVLALLLAGLTFLNVVQVWHILALAALGGIVNAFDIPARQSFLSEMVERADLPNAIALNSSMFNGARIVGPAIAGLVVGAVGEAWCFLGNGVSYIAVICGLLAMRLQRHLPPAQKSSTLHRIAEGFRFINQTHPIRTLLVLVGIVSFAAGPYSVLMPVFAKEILHGDASSLGLLLSCSGAGALFGALFLANRKGFRGLGNLIAVSGAVLGAALVLFSYSKLFWLSGLLLFPVGMAMMIQIAGCNTLVQAMVPDALRGRVMSVYSMVFIGGAPLGALISGALTHIWGAPTVVALGGAITLVAALVFRRYLPKVRAEARELIMAQQADGYTG